MTERIWREITVNEKTLRTYIISWIALSVAVVLLVTETKNWMFPGQVESRIEFILAEIGYIGAILFATWIMKKYPVFPKKIESPK